MKKPIQVFNFSIQNQTENSVDIHIDGEIVDASSQAMIEAFFGDTTSVSYRSFRNSITNSKAKIINVIINSPGGHAGDALAIYDYLTDLQNKGTIVNTIGRGIVASAATFILMAGEAPEMSENSWWMMHNATSGIYGTVDQIENYAATMRKFNNSLRDLYAKKSGMRPEEVTKLMNAETWLTASDAKAKGFISKITGEAEYTNAIDRELWNISNTAIVNQYNAKVKKPDTITNQLEDMKNIFVSLKNEIINAITGIKPVEGMDMNVLATAITSPFENIGDQLQTEVTAQISSAVAPYEARIAALEQKNVDLETEITNLAGKPTTTTTEVVEAPIGHFS